MALRQRIWIDDRVQGVLVGRVVIYWLAGIAYLGLGIAFFEFLNDSQLTTAERFRAFAGQFLLWLPSLVLLLPLVVFDVVRLSHLFTGPIYRLRTHLASLVQDCDCRPLAFRADDYWQDLADPINALQDQLRTLKQRVAELEQMQQESGGPACEAPFPPDGSAPTEGAVPPQVAATSGTEVAAG